MDGESQLTTWLILPWVDIPQIQWVGSQLRLVVICMQPCSLRGGILCLLGILAPASCYEPEESEHTFVYKALLARCGICPRRHPPHSTAQRCVTDNVNTYGYCDADQITPSESLETMETQAPPSHEEGARLPREWKSQQAAASTKLPLGLGRSPAGNIPITKWPRCLMHPEPSAQTLGTAACPWPKRPPR